MELQRFFIHYINSNNPPPYQVLYEIIISKILLPCLSQFKTAIIWQLTFFVLGSHWEILRKINQNQKTSWDCNSCSAHSIYMR